MKAGIIGIRCLVLSSFAFMADRSKKRNRRAGQNAPKDPEVFPAGPPIPWSRRKRIVLSLIAVIHLAIVFSSPWAIPRPSSRLARLVNDSVAPVAHLLYTRHGYRFFAPDPGPSHLILYEVTTTDGETMRGRFPDRNQHWPRLLYHRFFMISEHFWNIGMSQAVSDQQLVAELERAANYLRENGLGQQSEWILDNMPEAANRTIPEDEIDRIVEELKAAGKHHAARTARRNLEEQNDMLRTAKKHYDVWLQGIAGYLKKKHRGTHVRIWIQEHLIPDYDHILDGGSLTDPENYGPRHLVYSEDEVVE